MSVMLYPCILCVALLMYLFVRHVMFLYVGSYLLISVFESWITGVCSPYVISLCDFVYYVVR